MLVLRGPIQSHSAVRRPEDEDTRFRAGGGGRQAKGRHGLAPLEKWATPTAHELRRAAGFPYSFRTNEARFIATTVTH